ncbi:nucleocapsid protein [Emaravirus kiwii]|uniref:Nucleocapsid protein n=1 Tax=Emaravirus kiwii TaxID=2660760 RepID=A0A5Q5AR48_9VIRU|nr:nucleocapsid protein [Emaravirus kiwii]QEE82888.1 nucleocapsid protein [Emaravirus kiwii]
MPPKSNNLATSSSRAEQVALKDDTVILGSGSKLRALKLSNVVNGKLNNPESSELKAQLVEPVAFTSASQSISNFTLHRYRNYCHVDTVAAHLSKSKENKEKLQKMNLVLKTSTKDQLVVVKDLNDSNIENVVSFNKSCAIMAAGILKHTFDEEFDWKIGKYVKTENAGKTTPNPAIVNRLAGQMGLTPNNPYYWMIVPGYEFLYELYPAEVLAYTLIRLQFRKNLNIPDKMTDSDIVSSLVMKMNRIHKLEVTGFDEALRTIGADNVSEAYVELARDIGTTSKTKRNDEAIIKFRELISSFMPALEADRIANSVVH